MTATNQDRDQRLTEYALLDDTGEGGRLATLTSTMRLLRMLLSYKSKVAASMAFGAISTACMVAMVIDRHITKGSSVSDMTPLLTALLALSLLQFGFQYMNHRTQTLLGHSLLYDQRSALFDHMLRLSMTFYDRNQIGRVMSRVQNDVQQIQEVMNVGMLALSETFILIGITIGMLVLDLRLALISLLSVVLISPVVIAWQRYARAAYIMARQTVA